MNPPKLLTERQFERIASRIILVEDATVYKAHVMELAADLAPDSATPTGLIKSKASIAPVGIPMPTPFVENDFTMNWHWIWTGSITPEQMGHRLVHDYRKRPSRVFRMQPPYSVIKLNGRRTSAHRALYEHFVEELDGSTTYTGRTGKQGKMIQDCGVPLCVNPRHWHHQLAHHKRRDEVMKAPNAATEPASTLTPVSVPQAEVEELIESMLALHQPRNFADVIAHEYFKYGDIPENQIKSALQAVGKGHLIK